MYAYAKVIIERPGVWALPVSALMHLGDKTILQVGEKTFCWMYEDGRAKRIEVETGVLGDADPASREPVDRSHQSPRSRRRRPIDRTSPGRRSTARSK